MFLLDKIKVFRLYLSRKCEGLCKVCVRALVKQCPAAERFTTLPFSLAFLSLLSMAGEWGPNLLSSNMYFHFMMFLCTLVSL